MGAVKERPIKMERASKRRNLSCFSEMMDVMACYTKHSHNTELCAREQKAMTECMLATRKKGKEVNTVNYHLGRLQRLMKMK